MCDIRLAYTEPVSQKRKGKRREKEKKIEEKGKETEKRKEKEIEKEEKEKVFYIAYHPLSQSPHISILSIYRRESLSHLSQISPKSHMRDL